MVEPSEQLPLFTFRDVEVEMCTQLFLYHLKLSIARLERCNFPCSTFKKTTYSNKIRITVIMYYSFWLFILSSQNIISLCHQCT